MVFGEERCDGDVFTCVAHPQEPHSGAESVEFQRKLKHNLIFRLHLFDVGVFVVGENVRESSRGASLDQLVELFD